MKQKTKNSWSKIKQSMSSKECIQTGPVRILEIKDIEMLIYLYCVFLKIRILVQSHFTSLW